MISGGVARIEDIAAVTFTRKAAAQLVGRCRIELEKRLAAETGDAAQRLRRALADMERMFAGTIHAFCAQLLRERPVEAGIALNFNELDDIQDEFRRQRAWREYLEIAQLAGSSILAELEVAQVRSTDLDEALATLCLYPDVHFPPGNSSSPNLAAGWAGVQRFSSALQALLPGSISSDSTCNIQKQAREFFPALRWADRARASTLAQLLSGWDKSFKATQKWWNSKPDALKAEDLVQHFQTETVTPFLETWRQYLYRLIVTLGVEARDFAAEARRRAAELNYEDLLQRTAKVLRTNCEVRESLQRKYPRIFVDEFQDTDPIQSEIVFLLAAEPGATPEWTTVPLRPGALFLVGDPKQSIFRFRRADIDIYERAKQRIVETGGKVVELTTCFRAVPELSRWANEAFSILFPTSATSQQPAYRQLDGVGKPEAAGPCGVFQLCLPASLNRKEVPTADAQAISAYIRSEVTSKRRNWGDFLVLTRKKEHLGLYATELEHAGVPYEVSGSEAFRDSYCVEALKSLLYALANPDDAVALVGVLRGPLFGFDDEALFQYHTAGGRMLLNAPIASNSTGPIGEALHSIQEMYRWTRMLPVCAAVERIFDRTGLLAKASAESAGGAEAGKLIFAVDCLRAASEVGASFAEAIGELEARLGTGEADPPSLEPGRQDVVRLMNLHKAKGLEAKVVFLADPLAGWKPTANVRIIREGDRPTGYFQVTRRKGEYQTEVVAEPQSWAAHEAAELAYVTAEECRLLYVACTRPMEMLVVSRWDKQDRLSVRPWELLAPFLGGASQLEIPPAIGVPPVAAREVTDEIRLTGAKQREILGSHLQQPTSIMEAVTKAARGDTHGSPPTEEPHGPVWGRMIHALLAYAVSNPTCCFCPA